MTHLDAVRAIICLSCLAAPAIAQSTDNLDLTKVGTDARWKVAGRTTSVGEVKGKRALTLAPGEGIGIVWLDGYHFTNGTIELDILGRSAPPQGSFVGVAFRVVDARTHDLVYFRPFNFRAADSTPHSHAVQYASHPDWPWQRLRQQRPGQYEKPIVPEPNGDEWFHARIVVERPKISVFVNGASAPSLVVAELSSRTDGAVGVWVGEGSGGSFANFRVTPSAASPQERRPETYGQQLVRELVRKHRDVLAAMEIALLTDGNCATVAATDPKDVGEACDDDEKRPIRSGVPNVEAPTAEDPVFDITQALHDSTGRLIGAVGMDVKPATNRNREAALSEARALLRELEAKIPSSAALRESNAPR